MANPYKDIDDFCFWSRAMTEPAPGHIDPVTRSQTISPEQKVATMGSCFAQHLARHIKASGLNYHIAEPAPESLSADEATRRNYGVFSARYGNVYTVRQAIQLFDRAFGQFKPAEDVWRKGERFVDAFRPLVEPDGYGSEAEVRAAAEQHLACVKTMFEQADWLVFTLGLTEAWRSRHDGAIYPVVPGASGGEYDAQRYEFVNFSADEVQRDLSLFIDRVRAVNPRLRILLTVSPVPLIATWERRHVWVSTTVSKAILRVAADVAERQYQDVIYFPSYEVITSPAAGGRYYADNLRDVTMLGVKHVMRLFAKHFFAAETTDTRTAQASNTRDAFVRSYSDLVCDEEVIERALREARN